MQKTLSAFIQSKEGTWVDVRTIDEFQQAHLPMAIHIPLDELPNRLQEISVSPKPIILYCHSGYRSELAAEYLQQQGLVEVINGGGIYQLMQLFESLT